MGLRLLWAALALGSSRHCRSVVVLVVSVGVLVNELFVASLPCKRTAFIVPSGQIIPKNCPNKNTSFFFGLGGHNISSARVDTAFALRSRTRTTRCLSPFRNSAPETGFAFCDCDCGKGPGVLRSAALLPMALEQEQGPLRPSTSSFVFEICCWPLWKGRAGARCKSGGRSPGHGCLCAQSCHSVAHGPSQCRRCRKSQYACSHSQPPSAAFAAATSRASAVCSCRLASSPSTGGPAQVELELMGCGFGVAARASACDTSASFGGIFS
jgi:hypothetical protein